MRNPKTKTAVDSPDFFLLLGSTFMRYPFLNQRGFTRLALQQAKTAFNHHCCDRLEQNAIHSSDDDGASTSLNLILLAQPLRNHHLAVGGDPKLEGMRVPPLLDQLQFGGEHVVQHGQQHERQHSGKQQAKDMHRAQGMP